jgi:hypothetical protein
LTIHKPIQVPAEKALKFQALILLLTNQVEECELVGDNNVNLITVVLHDTQAAVLELRINVSTVEA